MATTAHPLSTGIAAIVCTISSILPSSLVALRDKLARTGVESTSARTRLSLGLTLGLCVLVSASTLASSSAAAASDAATTLGLWLLLGCLSLCLLRELTEWILLVRSTTSTASSASRDWKPRLQCAKDSAGWWLVRQVRTLRLLFVLDLAKGIGNATCGRGRSSWRTLF
ncbi:hypothetical protein BDV10DRAFT_176147 [Aspergillus recurvatus]